MPRRGSNRNTNADPNHDPYKTPSGEIRKTKWHILVRKRKRTMKCRKCKRVLRRDMFQSDESTGYYPRHCIVCTNATKELKAIIAVGKGKAKMRDLNPEKTCRRCKQNKRRSDFPRKDGRVYDRCNTCVANPHKPRTMAIVPLVPESVQKLCTRTATFILRRNCVMDYPSRSMAVHLDKVWDYKCAVCPGDANRYIIHGPGMHVRPDTSIPLCKACCNKHERSKLVIPAETLTAIDKTLAIFRVENPVLVRYERPDASDPIGTNNGTE